ncbi:uncharacterized protein FIBRA_01072 [Fibroporia radiculosa]|uniref:Uncharacterized protein n=1 Tax=Fibroporia radiculosa TaxID=599839 RepID=J4I8A3_9APHY|nr:uncharacterized protein FIBRA_01072 [Fibroporia radiculosa]CCL99061.1 predicted protein [Fibroporia radiculosa]
MSIQIPATNNAIHTVGIVTDVLNILFSSTILVLILIKTYINTRHVVPSVQHRGAQVFILFTKDGILQFIGTIFANVTNLVAFSIGQTGLGVVTFVVNALIVVLVSRFIFSIRAIYTHEQGETTIRNQMSLQFADINVEQEGHGMLDNAEEDDNDQSRIFAGRIGFERSPYHMSTSWRPPWGPEANIFDIGLSAPLTEDTEDPDLIQDHSEY